MNKEIRDIIELIDFQSISEERKAQLQVLINYLKGSIEKTGNAQLNFICTHNSRRSQLSQVWAKVAASHYGVPLESFSGGVEVTACNERTIASLKRFGFNVSADAGENPHYMVSYAAGEEPIVLFSKLFDDKMNPGGNFGAVMTCSHADENCPVVTGCEQRISLRYEDPKAFDNSAIESSMYDARSFQIATEMFYVFNLVSHG